MQRDERSKAAFDMFMDLKGQNVAAIKEVIGNQFTPDMILQYLAQQAAITEILYGMCYPVVEDIIEYDDERGSDGTFQTGSNNGFKQG